MDSPSACSYYGMPIYNLTLDFSFISNNRLPSQHWSLGPICVLLGPAGLAHIWDRVIFVQGYQWLAHWNILDSTIIHYCLHYLNHHGC